MSGLIFSNVHAGKQAWHVIDVEPGGGIGQIRWQMRLVYELEGGNVPFRWQGKGNSPIRRPGRGNGPIHAIGGPAGGWLGVRLIPAPRPFVGANKRPDSPSGMLVHWPVNTMRVNQLLDQDKTVDDDTIQHLWRGWLWSSTPNSDTRLAGGGWNANHAVGALLARALYVCECNAEERDAPNDLEGSTGPSAPGTRGDDANGLEGSTGPSAPGTRGEDAPGEPAMQEEEAGEADLANELDTLWTAFPLITELHVSPSEFHYMTLREIRDATEVSVASKAV